MKLLEKKGSNSLIEFRYNEIGLLSATLAAPNHAFPAPSLRKKINYPHKDIGTLGKEIYDMMMSQPDFEEYHSLALLPNSQDDTNKYLMKLEISNDDILLLKLYFKESALLIKDFDDFHTITGYDWSEVENLQKDLDDLFQP